MGRWFRNHFHREMLRPLIYKVFTRGVLALFAARLVHFFAPSSWPLASFRNLALMLGLLFSLFTVLAWLRMDGLRVPQLKLPRLRRKEPPFLTGDMADHLDEEIVQFDDLEEEDQNACVFLADLILSAGCLLLAALL